MGFDPREFLQRLRETNTEIRRGCPEAYDADLKFQESELAPGKVDARTKELVALGASLFAKCPYCIPYHVQRALKMGIARDEMIEIGLVVATVGGG